MHNGRAAASKGPTFKREIESKSGKESAAPGAAGHPFSTQEPFFFDNEDSKCVGSQHRIELKPDMRIPQLPCEA